MDAELILDVLGACLNVDLNQDLDPSRSHRLGQSLSGRLWMGLFLSPCVKLDEDQGGRPLTFPRPRAAGAAL